MKKFFCGFTIVISLLISCNLHAGKLDPFWKVAEQIQTQSLKSTKSYQPSQIVVEAFIKSTDTTMTAEKVANVGGKVRSIIGSIMTVSIPASKVEAAGEWPEVEYIEAAKPMKPQNDLAVADTGVTAVHAGTSLPHGYDGTGVIVGIIDSGIDLTHPAFKDETGQSRVLYIWDQTDTSGPGPSEISSTYGTEYKHSAIIAGTTNHKDTFGHGTHVAGTAAGLDTTYTGVASNSFLIIVKNTSALAAYDPISTYVCDAANYIFQKASYLNLPAVINISAGTNYGPHDGTSLFEQCLDSLVEAAPGRAIAVSAGNSANPLGITTVGAHINYSVDPSQKAGSSIYPLTNAYPFFYLIEIWEEADCNTNLQVGLWDRTLGLINATPWVAKGNTNSGFWGPMAYLVDRSDSPSPLNGKNHSLVGIAPDALFDVSTYFFDVVFDGSCSGLNAWIDPYMQLDFGADSGIILGVDYHPGNSISTVMSPATASNVLAVGAYTTRTSWTDINGNSQSDPLGLLTTTGDLGYFSSRGPALNIAQGQKPNIAGPGAFIISAYSSTTDSPDPTMLIDSSHVVMEGTSMSSPHVAGVVALMLQAYPGLTYDQITTYLQSTARADSFVGSAPNGNWGYGKVDASAAVAAVTAAYPPGVGDGDFSGITITGLSDAGSVSNDTTEFWLTFPRPVLHSTCSTGNIFIAPVSGASASVTKASWDSSACNVASALPASTSIDSNTQVRLILNAPIGEGNFVFCISPSVHDADEITFGGKTIEFAAASSGGGGGGSGGGCELVHTSRASSVIEIVLMCAAFAAVFTLRYRNNRKSGIL